MSVKGLVLDERIYTGDVAPGDAFEDASSKGNDGVHTDITWVKTDKGLWVRSFDGSSSLIDCGNNKSLANLPAFTLIMWINSIDSGELSAGRLFQKALDDNTVGWRLSFPGIGGDLYFSIDFATDLVVRTGNDFITFGVWQMVALTWDGSLTAANVHLFNNAVEENSYNTQTDGVGARVDDTATKLILGNTPDTSKAFNGLQALPRILNYALSAEQIAEKFESERRYFGR